MPLEPNRRHKAQTAERKTCSPECLLEARQQHARDLHRDRGNTVWTREKIIRVLQREAKKGPLRANRWQGRRATPHAVTGEPRADAIPTTYLIGLHFGSWSAALEAAGLPTRSSGGQRRWTDEQIIHALQQYAKRWGHPPSIPEWRRRGGRPDLGTIQRWFGSWNAALEAARLVTHEKGGRGERNGNAKLTAEAVREIRASTESLRVLAERYGVCRSTVSHIRTGRNWRGQH